ncbi:hypothetical protein EAG18_17190 [Pseudoalteromonas sp. J010]|nr:hypothetical protein EAG18_17190 [Pseudoalteromonas sp. J010]
MLSSRFSRLKIDHLIKQIGIRIVCFGSLLPSWYLYPLGNATLRTNSWITIGSGASKIGRL